MLYTLHFINDRQARAVETVVGCCFGDENLKSELDLSTVYFIRYN